MTVHTDGGYALVRDPWGGVHRVANLPSGTPFTPPGWQPVEHEEVTTHGI